MSRYQDDIGQTVVKFQQLKRLSPFILSKYPKNSEGQ